MSDSAENSTQQYIRAFSLIVYGSDLNGLDLSALRIKFQVKRSNSPTPNTAEFRIYNISEQTAVDIFTRLTPKTTKDGLQTNRGHVLCQAGYGSNYGVIFQGNIKQVIVGRESATDTFIDIIAGDGDLAYNYAVVNSTIAPGATSVQQVNAAIESMGTKGVTAGHMGEFSGEALPRGKVMFGNARNYLRNVADTQDKTWSIQDGKVNFVSNKAYLPGEAVVLTSKTGMVGTPQQTNEGVNVKCLLNPRIAISGRIQIDNKSIERVKINLAVAGSPANIPAPLSADGFYFVLVVDHSGDTRNVEWYSTMVCLNIDPTTNPINSVQLNYGR